MKADKESRKYNGLLIVPFRHTQSWYSQLIKILITYQPFHISVGCGGLSVPHFENGDIKSSCHRHLPGGRGTYYVSCAHICCRISFKQHWKSPFWLVPDNNNEEFYWVYRLISYGRVSFLWKVWIQLQSALILKVILS